MNSNEINKLNKNLLWIISSCKDTEDSLSSRIGKILIEYLHKSRIISKFRERNVNRIAHIDYNTVSKMYANNQIEYENTTSSYLVNEFLNSEIIVISTPMYNFGCPSALKAWIDHIVVRNKTFKYDKTGARGLCSKKIIYLVVTSGGSCDEGSSYDFISTYLKHIFKFIGCDDVRTIWINNTNSRSEEDIFKLLPYQISGVAPPRDDLI